MQHLFLRPTGPHSPHILTSVMETIPETTKEWIWVVGVKAGHLLPHPAYNLYLPCQQLKFAALGGGSSLLPLSFTVEIIVH